MTNPFDEFLSDAASAVKRALNPNPTDAAVYEKDGDLYLRLIYGDTSGSDMNIKLPKKDLTSVVKGITDYLLK
jgi:hypothetical protein